MFLNQVLPTQNKFSLFKTCPRYLPQNDILGVDPICSKAIASLVSETNSQRYHPIHDRPFSSLATFHRQVERQVAWIQNNRGALVAYT